MPRRKNTDGDGNQTVKQPRVRKKKEPSSICSTPTTEHSSAQMKLEMGHSMPVMPPGCGSVSQMDVMMGGPPMHVQHLPNGTPCDAGPHHQQMMEEGSNGPGGIGPPFGGGPPHSHQGPPFDFYQQGPLTTGGPGPPTQFMPPPMPMFSGGPPLGHSQMMMHQSGQPPMGSVGVGPAGQQFHSGPDDVQPHPQQQIMSPMPPHHLGSQPGPGPMSAPPGQPQMPPHQMPPPHSIFPPGAFPPRQPGPLMFLPPHINIPQPPFLEFRLQEMNRRLHQFHCQFYQQAPSEQTEQWWDAFSQEFFDDLGRMTLCLHEYSAEQGVFVPKQYIVSRQLIPRFYRSLFTSGVSSLNYLMRSPAQEMIDPRIQSPEFGCCALNCENLLMIIGYDKPIQAEVQIECRLYMEFAPFNPTLGYRVRHWAMELRAHQEFVAKDVQIQQMDMERKHLTSYGLPFSTHNQLKMWQLVQRMEPIIERSKDTNEPPQLALHQIVMENGQMERQQRMAAQAAAAVHIQSPTQHQPGNGPPQHPMAALISGMGPPQIPPNLPPGLLPPPQMGPPIGVPPQPQQQQTPAIEEQKPTKPKRIRQRKSAAQQQAAAAATNGGGGGNGNNNNNTSPSKGKKGGGQSASTQNAGQLTPPTGIPQMPNQFPPMSGPQPGQFHQQMGMPPNQYHHDVLTVGEPSMMGCEYGEQDERQISRVENTAFAGLNHHPNVSQGGPLMMGAPGSCGPPLPPQPTGPQMTMATSLQQQMGENSQTMLGDFIHPQQQQPQQLHHQQQQSLQMQPSASMWSTDSSQQQAMSSGS